MKESYIAKGRIGVYLPNHPGANNRGYILKSRYVMEQKLGRLLLPKEIVHHENDNKTDDSPENLELTNQSKHAKEHYEKGHYNLRAQIRRLDYEKIADLRKEGIGYKKASKILGYNVHSVKSVYRRMRDNKIVL